MSTLFPEGEPTSVPAKSSTRKKKEEPSEVAVFVDAPPVEAPDPPVAVETGPNENQTIRE